MDYHALWNWYQAEQGGSTLKGNITVACRTCRATVSHECRKEQGTCPRCCRKLHLRIRHSLQKTTALLIAATILYIPALSLPIMTVVIFGVETQDTILSGVIHLFGDGLWFIGMIVFVASILVPILKLCILGYLLWSVYHGHTMHRYLRHRLFHLIEFIGRWSMIDVFVITLLVALVQFGVIVNIRAEPAALAFASVVIITMIAVETFDSRLLWDDSPTILEQH
jgi:paraquat-inducible protein A